MTKSWYLIALLIFIFGGWWTWSSQVPTSAETTLGVEAAIGQRAPDFALPTLDGETFTLSEALADGSPVVLNFWATWCAPCERELPALQSTAVHYGERAHVVGVNLDQLDAAEYVDTYVSERDLTFTIPLDPEQATAQTYNIIGMPTTFFIDGDGVIQQVWPGEMNRITLVENIEAILP